MAVDYKTLKKNGFMRQKQKNMFSLRLRVVGGNVTAVQLAKIAEVAEKFGDGHVHLTSRQSVEIPFIKLEEIEQVKAALAEGGVEPSVCGAQVRTITACQGSAVCSSGCIDTYAIAKELDDRYFSRELPHKFKIGITGCQNNCLKAEENDLGIKGAMKTHWKESDCIHCGLCEKACRRQALSINDGKIMIDYRKCNFCGRCAKSCPVNSWDVTRGYVVTFGGLFGNHINKGRAVIPFIADKEKLLKICDTAIQFFDDHANPGERFKFTIDRVGWDEFRKTISEAYESE
ncbi:MAG: 4Fe-4S binding protein [Oscillospiraceae bacterium]|nr:4Fe-4S binding protein [Oscillospiraceae bacterium]